MTPEQHDQDLETWRAVVGRAIVCFGELELVTYKCLAHIPSDRISQTSSRLPFARRVDLIVEILEGRAPLPAPVASFVKQLRRAKELSQTRNDIAHNPIMLNVFVHEATGDVALENCIATARGGRLIDLAEAKEFADEVENLVSEMWLLDAEARPSGKKRRTVAEVDGFITMLRAACEDRKINERLERVLSMPDERRQAVVHLWVSDMLIAGAPSHLIQAVACLLDDQVAQKAYEVIYKCQR